jgi:hypothetical protein
MSMQGSEQVTERRCLETPRKKHFSVVSTLARKAKHSMCERGVLWALPCVRAERP